MVNEKNKNKKPLVTLDAANPAPDASGLVKPAPATGGWAGLEAKDTGGNNGLPIVNENQLRNIENAPDGVNTDDVNKLPVKNVQPSAQVTKWGVLQGAPSQVVLQHMIDDIPVETEEQRKRREKAEKRNALFAAIGDGISALSNLYFTTKGSPSADQSKSLSKAESERKDKAKRERESNVDRRIRLLKEQRADFYNMQGMKIREQMAEAQKAYQEARTAAERKKAEDYMKYLTQKNQILKEEKEAEVKRKDEEAKQKKKESENRIADSNKRTSGYLAGVSNQNKNRDRNTSDMIAKRGRNQRQYNPANDPGMQKVVEKDRKTGKTTTYYEPRKKPDKPAPKNSGGSAKSKFSIHK